MGIGCRFNSVCISLVSWWVLAISFYYSDSNGRSRRSPSGLCFNPQHHHQSYIMHQSEVILAPFALLPHIHYHACTCRALFVTAISLLYLPITLRINLSGARMASSYVGAQLLLLKRHAHYFEPAMQHQSRCEWTNVSMLFVTYSLSPLQLSKSVAFHSAFRVKGIQTESLCQNQHWTAASPHAEYQMRK